MGTLKLLRLVGLVALASACACAAACEETPKDDDGDGGGTTTSNTTSTSQTTGSTTTTDTGTTTGTVTCNVEYTSVPKGECDLLAQDCPAGFWCDVNGGADATVCKPDTGGVKGAGEKCGKETECQKGLLCVDGSCTPFCCPETDQPCNGGTCDIQLGFNNPAMSYAMVCSYSNACELFKGTCADGEHCHIADADQGLAVCDKPSSGFTMEGGECQYRNDCGESMLCNRNGDDDLGGGKGRCRHLCDATNFASLQPEKGGCLPDRTCTPVNAGMFMNLGICMASAM